jgi:hypothetical protein
MSKTCRTSLSLTFALLLGALTVVAQTIGSSRDELIQQLQAEQYAEQSGHRPHPPRRSQLLLASLRQSFLIRSGLLRRNRFAPPPLQTLAPASGPHLPLPHFLLAKPEQENAGKEYIAQPAVVTINQLIHSAD